MKLGSYTGKSNRCIGGSIGMVLDRKIVAGAYGVSIYLAPNKFIGFCLNCKHGNVSRVVNFAGVISRRTQMD